MAIEKVVLVVWEDAAGDSKWQDRDDLDKEEYIVHSVGTLLERTKRHTRLALNVVSGYGVTSHVMTIPQGMIRSYKVIGKYDSSKVK